MNYLRTFLHKIYKKYLMLLIIPDETDNTLESKVYRITKDFRTTDPEINENLTQLVKILKKTLKEKYIQYFPYKILISLLHKSDTWNITDCNGQYIVAADFREDLLCEKRYLILVNCNNVKVIDEIIINKYVKPKNIIS